MLEVLRSAFAGNPYSLPAAEQLRKFKRYDLHPVVRESQ